MNEWIYDFSHDNKVRYTLGQPSLGGKNLVCFGINPSTAEPDNLDPTLKSVKRIAIENGYDGWIMLNVYPQRATNPNDMHTEIDENIHATNLQYIADIVSKHQCDIWAAWGTLINKRPYLPQLLQDIHRVITISGSSRWICFGNSSKQGHPHHPLYLRTDSKSEDFPMDKYLQECIL